MTAARTFVCGPRGRTSWEARWVGSYWCITVGFFIICQITRWIMLSWMMHWYARNSFATNKYCYRLRTFAIPSKFSLLLPTSPYIFFQSSQKASKFQYQYSYNFLFFFCLFFSMLSDSYYFQKNTNFKKIAYIRTTIYNEVHP